MFPMYSNGNLKFYKHEMKALMANDHKAHLNLDKIVKAVQVHKHTKKSCLKHGHGCRFNFPRFPSDETLIAKPYSNPELDEKQTKAKIEAAKKILEKVKCER